ncbi:NADP-dependent oxidoreductase domain-containing protein [Mycena albidolilacea]|uniref:NADP-dependent oxidoreductase domain-containing protein n=1 Tax=Mycena albidolilacea TaxID=1033008 RepID=A0AAD7EQW0_9AGAR|nr:NADP-dependent oxidoreductase domain-containing protein [Mycena albidolilacea]
MAAIPSIKLNTGAEIPAIGLGGGPDGFAPEDMAASEKWFLTAFEAGYRHFDTAWAYGTEPGLGAALRASKVPREEVFITTKLPWHHPKYVERSFNDSLSRLGVDYVDLYLMHWPQALTYPTGYDFPTTVPEIFGGWTLDEGHTFNQTWAEMERLHSSGKARAIGVSNFSIKTLEELFKTAKIVPAVNQVEMHPYHADTELLEYCRKKGIVVTAYSPTGYQKLRSDPVLVALGEKYKVSPTQVILAWHVARGVVAVPKSSNAGRQKQNLILPTLSAEDVASVTALDRKQRCEQWGAFGPDGKLLGWTAEQYGW